MSHKALICLLLILSISVLNAQEPQTFHNSTDSAWYDQLLYNGTEWRPTMHLVDGHEFFLTSEFLHGSVTIEGITFNEIRMRYDICNDHIIILWKNTFPLVIDSKNVDEFTFTYNGVLRKFVNLGDKYPVIKGFAEVLYKGKSLVVVKYTKVISKNPTQVHYSEFREDTRYYFIVNGNCCQIRNKSSFLKAMGENEIAVRKFIRQQKVFVSIVSPGGFGIAATYFDSLPGKKRPD